MFPQHQAARALLSRPHPPASRYGERQPKIGWLLGEPWHLTVQELQPGEAPSSLTPGPQIPPAHPWLPSIQGRVIRWLLILGRVIRWLLILGRLSLCRPLIPAPPRLCHRPNRW
jgi:hypothetical protein